MDYEIYDVTNFILTGDMLICAMFDGRYNSIAIIQVAGPDKWGKYKLDMTEPDKGERLYWLDKFGLLTEEDMQAEINELDKQEKRGLYEKLKKEVAELDDQRSGRKQIE